MFINDLFSESAERKQLQRAMAKIKASKDITPMEDSWSDGQNSWSSDKNQWSNESVEETTGDASFDSMLNHTQDRAGKINRLLDQLHRARTAEERADLAHAARSAGAEFSDIRRAMGRDTDQDVEEDAKGYKSPTGGLTQKGRDHYNRTTGGHLKAPVTTKPSKLKPGSKAAKRRKSFCARMGGNKGPMKDAHGKPTRKALALRKWNCESVEQMQQMIEAAEQILAEAFIAPALSAANSNAEHERTRTFVPHGYKGRVDLAVSSNEEYLEVMNALRRAAKRAGQQVEAGLADTKMSVFSKTMDTDELDAFIDSNLGQSVAESRSVSQSVDTVSGAKKLWQYVSRNLTDLASNASFHIERNEVYTEGKLNNLFGPGVKVAFDDGGGIEFDQGVLYIPIITMWKYRGMYQASQFVQQIVQALPDQSAVDEATGDEPFDKMMKKVTKPLTQAQRRRHDKEENERRRADTDAHFAKGGGPFGSDPLAKFPSVKPGVSEAKSLSKRVRVVATGETGTIRQIKHGAFKGAAKTYFVDLDNGKQADNLPASSLRLLKDQGVAEATGDQKFDSMMKKVTKPATQAQRRRHDQEENQRRRSDTRDHFAKGGGPFGSNPLDKFPSIKKGVDEGSPEEDSDIPMWKWDNQRMQWVKQSQSEVDDAIGRLGQAAKKKELVKPVKESHNYWQQLQMVRDIKQNKTMYNILDELAESVGFDAAAVQLKKKGKL